MDWLCFASQCPSAAVEAVIAVMYEATAAGPAVEDAGELKRVSVYVPDLPQAQRQHAAIQAGLLAIPGYLTGGAPLELSKDTVREQDWAETWKEFYHPMRVGRRLVIKPSWEPWPPSDDPGAASSEDIVIELDPGMAFGTGSHASTYLILLVLEDLIRGSERVLDIGCGSGILSLAAARLGAAHVLAVDVDPVAVEVAEKNVDIGGVRGLVHVRQGDIGVADAEPYDLVVANINAPIVRAICPRVFELLRPGGYYIASGFTEQWVPDVTGALTDAGFHVVDVREYEGWKNVIGRKPGPEA